ncbi:MAG: alpha/beta hydrolase [Geminicoccaceae bacterium]
MRTLALRWSRRLALVVLGALVLFLGVRVWQVRNAPPLEPWHTEVPHDVTAAELAGMDWQGYLAAEDRVMAEVRTEVTDRLDPDERRPFNRYFADSPIYPGRFKTDWNRSQVLEPDGEPQGAMVFLHGLTDTPYSGRHIGRAYRDRGWLVLIPRMPAHGTVPAALTDVDWEDWTAAVRLAVREARRRVGPGRPLHIVGFSNGGALAVMHALDAIDDPSLGAPDRLILLSPMIGVTAFARFAGIAGWPAFFPAFANAAWLSVVPEFIPFKYNSFPVNGARQSYELTRALQGRIDRMARDGRLARLPPILTFQSVVDFTVSTRAIINALYARLPANGSELVLFDLNRTIKFGPLLSSSADLILNRVLPAPPRNWRTVILANASPGDPAMVARITEAGAATETIEPLSLTYPPQVFSLSHVALPFPLEDGLYGLHPDPKDDFGVQLGAMATRGERGALIMSLDSLMRMSSNPFFPYMLERIGQGIAAPRP